MNWRTCSVAIALAGVLFPSPAHAMDYCYILNVYHPEQYGQAKSISIGAFDVSDLPKEEGDTLDAIRAFMVDTLKKELTGSKYFSSVVVAPDGQPPQTDFVIAGSFVGLSQGSRWQRVMFARAGATLRLKGTLSTTRPEPAVVADYECYRENVGGILGVTGGLTGLFSGSGGNRSNMEKFAKGLAGSFKDVEKDAARFVRRAKEKKGARLTGASEPASKPKPKAAADDGDDVKDELSSYVVSTNREDWTQADLLWLTSAAYAANAKVNEIQPDIANQLAKKKTSVWSGEYGRGFLLDVEPLAQFEGKEVYVLGATFESNVFKHPPFFWDLQAMAAETSLSRADAPAQKVRPVQVLDGPSPTYLVNRRFRLLGEMLWRSHPTLFVFPARLPDGTPLISGLNQKLEFQTVVDNHPVVVKFDVSHFGLTSTQELFVKK